MAKEREAAKEDGETDSVFLAAWTSARIPPPGFSDVSFLSDEVRVSGGPFLSCRSGNERPRTKFRID